MPNFDCDMERNFNPTADIRPPVSRITAPSAEPVAFFCFLGPSTFVEPIRGDTDTKEETNSFLGAMDVALLKSVVKLEAHILPQIEA